jgi:4-carboxymuconolactone decarboxylase
MARLAPLALPDMDRDQLKLYHEITEGPRKGGRLLDEDGSPRGPFGPMLRSPAIGSPLQALGAAVRYSSSLAPDVRELAILTVATVCRSAFEWESHLPLAVEAGLDESKLANLWHGNASDFEDPLHVIVEAAVRQLVGSCTLDEDTYGRLAESLVPSQMVDLVVTVGYYFTLAALLNGFAIDP